MDVPPHRRWFSFNLRSLFIHVTLLAIGLGWVAKERSQSGRERDIIAACGDRAWLVQWVGPFDEFERSPQSWWRALLEDVLGSRVEHFMLVAPAGSDLSALAEFSRLRSLHLHADPGTDLRPLGRLNRLEALSLTAPKVSDIAALAGLEGLQTLDLDGTEVKDLSPVAKLANLKVLRLCGTNVRDLSPLARMTSLRELAVDRSFDVDPSGFDAIEHLRKLQRSDPDIDLTPLIELTQQQQRAQQQQSLGDDRNQQILKLQQALPDCKVTWTTGIGSF